MDTCEGYMRKKLEAETKFSNQKWTLNKCQPWLAVRNNFNPLTHIDDGIDKTFISNHKTARFSPLTCWHGKFGCFIDPLGQPIVTTSRDHCLRTCHKSVRPHFSKSSKTKQNENNVYYWLDCASGQVDHWWHLPFIPFLFSVVFDCPWWVAYYNEEEATILSWMIVALIRIPARFRTRQSTWHVRLSETF